MNSVAYLSVLCIVALNIWATVAVLRASMYELRQKRLQLALVWLVPVLGALVVLTFVSSQRSNNTPTRSDTNHEYWNNAQDKAHGVE